MWLIQFSDLHFSPTRKLTVPDEKVLSLLRNILMKYIPLNSKVLVCLCGDITYRGNKEGYNLAELFFSELQHIKEYRFVIYGCPGNHDIIDGDESFAYFNRFILSVSNHGCKTFSRSRTSISICLDNHHLIMVNSAFHMDIGYGFVNLSHLKEELQLFKDKVKIVAIHHHPIPVAKADISTIRNSYEFLSLSSQNNVKMILHGHRHMFHSLKVGTDMIIFGAGSPFFLDTLNVNNQFNLIKLDEKEAVTAISFKFIADKSDEGILGNFEETRI